MLYIFLVETNKNNKSDEMYIKSLLNKRYDYLGSKLKFIYLDGKGNYNKKEKEIKNLKSKYNGKTKVFMCIDLDRTDKQPYNLELNNEIMKYCRKNDFEFIWFNENIEQVFLGRSVDATCKKTEATGFFTSKKIDYMEVKNLKVREWNRKGTSNIVDVFDKYMKIKNI